ncbi:S8 family serine peptidase [Sphingomonas cannabina]|uniref:S8 family serine peptidase n=1 Tax=Sphingomonas cannabina TaxID=2899123 RepID=UPI001F3F5902|nr:S8 family serine peptidase [Sphingomonas cannabina]UIJ46087.1 S8 family serine peptidase [Sphingomonas cannabina]
MTMRFALTLVLAALTAAAAQAQLVPQLPSLPGPVGSLPGEIVDGIGRTTGEVVERVRDLPPQALAAARLDRFARLVRESRGRIALDDNGEPARAGEIVLTDPDAATLSLFAGRGYRLIEQAEVEGLGVGYARLAIPESRSLAEAMREARRLAPVAAVSADVLHFESGGLGTAAQEARASAAGKGIVVGMIDSGVGRGVGGPVRQQGFAAGAPRPSDHGTAVASLIAGGGPVRGGAPGAGLLVADVYGGDRAGGSAVAIARALGWLAGERAPVVAISLVGPPNPLLARTVAAAQTRGMVIVAAVGNDGPAAPPAYPASYPGVVAVTGVDGRGRALIEAGRAAHLDYAAPGADMVALDARGRARRVRGTSFAVPLVAAAIARAGGRLAAVDAAAKDLGTRGPDPVYGRGLVCGDCATRK